MKKYVIYAGVNGAGKSTFYNMKSQYNLPRVNSDEIVKELGDWKNIAERYSHEEVFSRLRITIKISLKKNIPCMS